MAKNLVSIDRMVLEYAIVALRGSEDNGDQYCASQIEEALGRGPLKAKKKGPLRNADRVVVIRTGDDRLFNKYIGAKGVLSQVSDGRGFVVFDDNTTGLVNQAFDLDYLRRE